jgi:CheY-like chemotaxis protein
MRMLGQRILEPEGFEVVLAGSAEEALRQLAHLPASRRVVLVTDSRMPGMTGDQLIHRARAVRPALPILRLSAEAMRADAAAEVPGPPLVEILKPFAPDAVVAAVRALADGGSSPG